MLGTKLAKDLPDGSEIRDILFFNPTKEKEMLTISDKTFPKSLVDSTQVRSLMDAEFSLTIKMIPLPPLMILPNTQSDIVWNVAVSSSPSDEDCVVAIKFLGLQLSLCRPHCDMNWTNIEVPSVASSVKLETAHLMYSKKDHRFYLPAPRANFLYSWDLLHLEKNESPEFHQLIFRDLPELPESEWGRLNIASRRTEHMVESVSTDERFFLKWYAQGYNSLSREEFKYTTMRFTVFREEETMERIYMCYTEDIGDVCIFLSKSEAFCVEASSCPGLKPNSIYYLGHDYGIYSIADKTSHHFQAPKGAPSTSFRDLYWLPPSCT